MKLLPQKYLWLEGAEFKGELDYGKKDGY